VERLKYAIMEFRRVLYIVLPTIVFMAASFGVNPLVRKIEMPFPRMVAFTIWGVALSLVSGMLFAFSHGTGFSPREFAGHLYPNVTTQIPPALTEEADFRLGIVGAVALAAGSLPFGLLHLIDLFYGVPVDFSQVIGIVLAGLMLSALYLRFGLWAAIGAHYGWNWHHSVHIDHRGAALGGVECKIVQQHVKA
jgi:hypothetical protein